MKKQVRYTKSYILENALKVIEEYKPTSFEELISFLDCSKATFYNVIKVNSKEYEQIFEEIKKSQLRVANTLKNKLLSSDNPTLIIAAIKMYGSEEDRQALANNYNVKANVKDERELEEESKQRVKRIEENLNKNLTKEEKEQFFELYKKVIDWK